MKLTKVLVISFCIIIILSQNVFALGNILSKGENFAETGLAHTNETMDTDDLKEKFDDIYNMLLALATVIAVIVGAILGTKLMAAGVEKKVEVKQSLLPYFISCIIVFGSLGIWKLVVAILNQVK